MQKKLITSFIIIFTFTALSAFAATNYLNSVVLEKKDNNYNIILRSDNQAKVRKIVQSSDRIILSLKGIDAANTLSTLYKDTSDVNSLVVENTGNNELRIYIQAPEISKANIVFETPASAPMAVDANSTFKNVIWSFLILAFIVIIAKSTRMLNKYEKNTDINRSIKDREVEMYKNFKREMAVMQNMKPNINYKIRKSAYTSNSIRKAETIRNYQYLTRLN